MKITHSLYFPKVFIPETIVSIYLYNEHCNTETSRATNVMEKNPIDRNIWK